MSKLAELFSEVGGKILPLLQDESINEVMLNPDGQVWIDSFKTGRSKTDIILSAVEAQRLIFLVAGCTQQTVTEESPDLSIELPQSGERFQALLPPLVKAPAFSIRKHCRYHLTLADYVANGSLTKLQATTLRRLIVQRKNIIVCGGTSSGKTTFVNALLAELQSQAQRIVVLEDTCELQCLAKDCLQIKTSATRSMRDLIRMSLRLRPDRIIVGEVRGAEMLELLKAWGTGHPGGIATVHADSAEQCLYRVADLVAEAVAAPQPRLITQSIDAVVFMQRVNGRRQVQSVVSVAGHGLEADAWFQCQAIQGGLQ